MRGLVVDRENGNIFKPDRYGFPGRARHGLKNIDRAVVAELYQRERTRLSAPALRLDRFAVRAARGGAVRRAWSTTSIATTRRGKPDYDAAVGAHPRVHRPRAPRRLDQDHRERATARATSSAIRAGRDAAQVPLVGQAALPADQLGLGLHERGDELPARRRARPPTRRGATTSTSSSSAPASRSSSPRSARSSSSTPRASRAARSAPDGPVPRAAASTRAATSRSSRSGRARAAIACCSWAITSTATCCARGSRRTGARRWSCRSWSTRSRRTIGCAPTLARLDRLDAELIHLDSELNERQTALRALQKLRPPTRRRRPGRRRRSARSRTRSRRCARDLRATRPPSTARSRPRSTTRFNPHWGPLFREGYEVSKFGEQVEAYACVYTSRVSNFRFYSPMQYFRGPRDRMPHERV